MDEGMFKPDVRMRWDAERGWLVFAPVVLSTSQLSRIAQWAEPKQVDRYRSLPPGERKEECARAVQDLRDGRVQCVIQNGDGVLFESTERTRPDRSIFVMGGENI